MYSNNELVNLKMTDIGSPSLYMSLLLFNK